MIIGINCGHTISGTVGSGAVGYINESDETRNIGYKLMELLKKNGVTVVDCTDDRSESVSENLSKIVSAANAQPLDLFVSIHFNAGEGRGSEVYTYGAQPIEQADNVCRNMEKLGFINRGIKDGSNLYVVRKSDAKAMLVEVCFVDTKQDVDLYNKIGVNKIAAALCDAIIGSETEEITMSQYEELKSMIEKENAKIDALRKTVENIANPPIYNYIDDNMPQWAREAVKWCVENDIISGTGEGLGLDYTKLWTCVVIYRLANM